MNDTIERTLYIILLLVFIGVGIAVYVAISFGAKLDQQLKDAAEQRKAQQTTLSQLKQDNAEQTAYIRCLLTAQNLGQYDATCEPPSAISGTSQNSSNVADSPATTSAPSDPSGSWSSPGLGQKLGNLLKKIGL